MAQIGKRAYAEMFGPTVGDRVRLADTDLVIEVEHDHTLRAGGYGEEVKFGGGKTIRDKNCEALKLSKTLYDMGMRVAAVSLLCQDKRVFDAMKMAGTPCPYEGKIGKEAAAAWQEKEASSSQR